VPVEHFVGGLTEYFFGHCCRTSGEIEHAHLINTPKSRTHSENADEKS